MMVKASNTAITNATALEPGRFEPKEETIIIKRIKWKLPKKSLQLSPSPLSFVKLVISLGIKIASLVFTFDCKIKKKLN